MAIQYEETDDSGKGGKSGEVKFHYRDILSTDPRDDALPDTEIRHLLAIHEDIHKGRVEEQRRTRKEREEAKKGNTAAKSYDGLGLSRGGGGSGSPYKQHPISNHAQFSGATDRKVTGVPSDNLAETNAEEASNKLENQLELRLDLRQKLQHKNAPKFHPTPRPF